MRDLNFMLKSNTCRNRKPINQQKKSATKNKTEIQFEKRNALWQKFYEQVDIAHEFLKKTPDERNLLIQGMLNIINGNPIPQKQENIEYLNKLMEILSVTGVKRLKEAAPSARDYAFSSALTKRYGTYFTNEDHVQLKNKRDEERKKTIERNQKMEERKKVEVPSNLEKERHILYNYFISSKDKRSDYQILIVQILTNKLIVNLNTDTNENNIKAMEICCLLDEKDKNFILRGNRSISTMKVLVSERLDFKKTKLTAEQMKSFLEHIELEKTKEREEKIKRDAEEKILRAEKLRIAHEENLKNQKMIAELQEKERQRKASLTPLERIAEAQEEMVRIAARSANMNPRRRR